MLNAVLERLDEVVDRLRSLEREVRRLSAPVGLMSTEEVCAALKMSRSGLSNINARGVFSDARLEGRRVRGRGRLYFTDEVQVYITERSDAAVKRFRREVGRLHAGR